MDDIIDKLKQKCIDEVILRNVRALLHADDTLILSFDKELFIHKCNVLVETFHTKTFVLNSDKSCHMVINAPVEYIKADLKIESGWLPYESSVVYLGVMFNDGGLLSEDINNQCRNKDKSVSIKLANFITNNMFAPITVKMKVLNTCVNVSISVKYMC